MMDEPKATFSGSDDSGRDELSNDRASSNDHQESTNRQKPTTDQLAGVYLDVEGKEDCTVRPSRIPRQFSGPEAVDQVTSSGQIWDIYIEVAGEEDLTERPARHLSK